MTRLYSSAKFIDQLWTIVCSLSFHFIVQTIMSPQLIKGENNLDINFGSITSLQVNFNAIKNGSNNLQPVDFLWYQKIPHRTSIDDLHSNPCKAAAFTGDIALSADDLDTVAYARIPVSHYPQRPQFLIESDDDDEEEEIPEDENLRDVRLNKLAYHPRRGHSNRRWKKKMHRLRQYRRNRDEKRRRRVQAKRKAKLKAKRKAKRWQRRQRQRMLHNSQRVVWTQRHADRDDEGDYEKKLLSQKRKEDWLFSAQRRFKRAATAKRERIWPYGVIPYYIPHNFTSAQVALFKKAMRKWENVSCVSFVEKEPRHTDYVYFTALECGCCSFVGRKGKMQSISIGKNCDKDGIVMHELGHAIGFWHEHTRPDRDKYIEILRENIQEDQKYNFNILTEADVNSLGEPYDFESIMHYAKNTFAKDALLEAIRPRPCCPRPRIGQRKFISLGDIRQVRKLYNCPACGRSLLEETAEFGFPDTDSTFTTPSLSNSAGYHCVWRISATQGEKILLDVLHLNLPESSECRLAYLEIRDGYDPEAPVLGRYCGNRVANNIISSGSRAWIEYKIAPDSVPSSLVQSGFRAKYKAVCGGILMRSEGIISSPNYPNNYKSMKECIWQIEVPTGYSVALKFHAFDLEKHQSCVYDYVEVREGWDQLNGLLIGKFCGYRIPDPVKSTGNRMTVKFKSDNSVTKNGFTLSYEKEYDECNAANGQKHGCQHICVNTLGGYHCDCKPGFHLHSDGKTCEDTCGGTLEANNGTLMSPSFPNLYDANRNCVWHIIAQRGYKIVLNFTHFDIEGRNKCEYDYLEINNGIALRNNKIGRFCGEDLPAAVTSESNTLRIEFVSDATVQKTGFRATFFVDRDECEENNGGCDHICTNTIGSYECGCRSGYKLHGRHNCKEGGCKRSIRSLRGNFTSPMYPQRYPLEKKCSWLFQTTPGHRKQLIFLEFDIERHNECLYDRIEIYNGKSNEAELIGKYCGDRAPVGPITSSSNYLAVYFISDSSLQRKGFRAEHLTICGGDLVATDTFQDFYSHAGFGDRDYGNKEDCNWTLTVPDPRYQVVLNIDVFELENEVQCRYDFVDMFDGVTSEAPFLRRFCGKNGPGIPVISSAQALHIQFRTDDTISNKGFHARFARQLRVFSDNTGQTPRIHFINGVIPLHGRGDDLPAKGKPKGYIDHQLSFT